MKAVTVIAAVKCPRCKMIMEYKVFGNLHMTNDYDPAETKRLFTNLKK